MDSWRSHLSYDTNKSENNLCLGEQWPLLLRVWKLGCARFDCPFWLSEKSPNVEIADGLMNLWLIMMDMGLCYVWRVPALVPTQLNHTQPHPIPQHVPSPHHEQPVTLLPFQLPQQVMLTTLHNPSVIKNVMHAHSFINFWLHKPRHTQHNPYPL